MINDPIVDEVRHYRIEHAKKFGYDLERIVEDLKKKEHASKHRKINPGPKILVKKVS